MPERRTTRSFFLGTALLCVWCAGAVAAVQSDSRAERVARLRDTAQAGDAAAQYELSSELSIEWGGPGQVEADRWLRESATRGYARAEYELGMRALAACGLSSDDCPEAIGLLRDAADQGLASAAYVLGGCYSEGRGVHVDAVAAFDAFQRAALSGHAGAARQLGVAYRDGIVVAPDAVESYKWFAIASERWIFGGAAEGQQVYRQSRDNAAARLSKAQLVEGRRAVAEWLDDFAGRNR